MSKTNIYILKLKYNKYYVGKSSDPESRFLEHLKGEGSTWTTKYEPIEFVEVIKNASVFDEDKYVKQYMSDYGINNVRGGSYVKEKLDQDEIYHLKKEIWAATNCCTQCGRKGHFIKDCKFTKDVYGESFVIWCCEYCNAEYQNEKECETHEKICKASKNNKTIIINQKNNCYNCGKSGHFASDCYAKKSFYKSNTVQSFSGFNKCYRCGRSGHYSNECYASSHAKGYYLDSDSD
jgi:predicted GIY-YIG superfamily endonuclease